MYKAVRFHLGLGRVAAQRLMPRFAHSLGVGALKLETLSDPPLPPVAAGGDWLALEPIYSGICGSDIGIITGQSSAYLAPLTSFPTVLGHEVVARRRDTGQAVVVDPALGCRARGLPLCRACAADADDGCERRADGHLGPGLMLGVHAQLPGAWSTRMWAAPSQLHPVPPSVPLVRAVLAEPLAIVLTGLDRVNWERVDNAVILGAGTLGLLATWAVAHRYHVSTAVQVRHAHQEAAARALGATSVMHDTAEAHERVSGAPLGRPMWGAPALYPWGPDLVIDTVGSAHTLAAALAITRPGGQILVLGSAHEPPSDLTPLWTRNLTVLGTYGYHSAGVNHFPAALTHLAAAPELDLMITHRWPLEEYRAALASTRHHQGGAIKSIFAITPP